MYCVVCEMSRKQCVVLPLLSCVFGLRAALPWLLVAILLLIDWWHPPAGSLYCDCSVLLCFLRVPALEDVESHWLHLSTLSDWRQPAATFQCCAVWLGGQKVLSKQGTSWCQYLSQPGWFVSMNELVCETANQVDYLWLYLSGSFNMAGKIYLHSVQNFML